MKKLFTQKSGNPKGRGELRKTGLVRLLTTGLLAGALCLLPAFAYADDVDGASADNVNGLDCAVTSEQIVVDNATDIVFDNAAENAVEGATENVSEETADNQADGAAENSADNAEEGTNTAAVQSKSVETVQGQVGGSKVISNTVKLTLNSKTANVRGSAVSIDAAPFATDGTTMLPLRFISQDILNAAVVWDSATNLVRVTKDGQTITIDLGYGKVYSNGQPYIMPVAPMVVDNRTLVPLRLITELMNCTVDYKSADKSVTITLPGTLEVQAPVASITYKPATAGQTIEYVDSSYDPAGYEITERRWTVTDSEGNTKSGESLYWLFYKRQGGDYTITYQIKNKYDLWSEPVSSEFHLETNKAPEITDLTTSSTSVDIGQSVDIAFSYDNEAWEELAATSFTYSWTDGGKTYSKTGKPAAFFASGKYTVTLRLQDAFGQWSEPKELVFDVSDTVQATEAEYRFTNLNPGEIYLNLAKKNMNGLLTAQTTRLVTQNVTLMDSNSPEKVTSPGLLYKDTLTGNIAVHYHHLNNSSQPLKIYMIAHNETSEPITFTIGKMGFAGPSNDPVQVGYIETQSYLTSTALNKTVTLQPGEMYLLNSSQSNALNVGYLQSALVDIQTNGQLTLAVVAMNTTAGYKSYTSLVALNSVGPQTRGTYERAAYDVSVTLGDDSEKIMLGYPDSFSGWFNGGTYLIQGVDKLTGEATSNPGNYGMVQTVRITATRRTGILLNPRGSVYRGALLWNGKLCLLSSGGQIQAPQESVVLGTIEAGETVTITYITPDGSDSPVLLVSIPEEQWGSY